MMELYINSMVGWSIKNLIFILFNSPYRAVNFVLYSEFYFYMRKTCHNTLIFVLYLMVYMHDNKLVMHYMWDHVFSTYQYYDSPLLPLYAVLIVAFVFVIGMCVDYLRLAFIEKPVMKRITSYIKSSQSWVAQKVPF